MLAQVEGVGGAGRAALEFERPGEKKPRRSGAEVRICRVPRVISGTSNHTRLPKQLRLLPQSGAPHAFIIESARQRAVPWASGQTGL